MRENVDERDDVEFFAAAKLFERDFEDLAAGGTTGKSGGLRVELDSRKAKRMRGCQAFEKMARAAADVEKRGSSGALCGDEREVAIIIEFLAEVTALAIEDFDFRIAAG